MEADGPILVAGGGIAGLAAALAFARRGFEVQVRERAAALQETGAGLQLSPNAARILFALGLRDALLAAASQPEAVVLIDAGTLRDVACIPLGVWGEERWGAPYLTCRRADLQRVLAEAVAAEPRIGLTLGRAVAGIDAPDQAAGRFLIGADGVHSSVRASLYPGADARSTGLTAWRATIPAAEASSLAQLRADRIAAFVQPRAHLVAYPAGPNAFNLVAFAATRGVPGSAADESAFAENFSEAATPLRELVGSPGRWTAWPLLTAPPELKWTYGTRAALIGDAAHAMAPFAAQGAAMAIEDAATLAAAFASAGGTLAARLSRWEAERRTRIAQVIRRGRLNRLTWHAAGPVALARNLVLKLRPPEKLAADLDWLYGWRCEGMTDRAA